MAETLKVFFRQRARLKKSIAELDFSQLMIKGRASQGNLFSRYPIHKIVLKEQGVSTLAGVNVWFDQDVLKLNTDGRGRLLGQFEGADKIIVYTSSDCYYTTGYEVGHHFPEDTSWVEKYDSEQVLSVVYWDDAQKYYYLKRFTPELSDRPVCYVDEENRKSRSVCLTKVAGCKVEVTYGGKNAGRPAEQFDVDSFVAVKSRKAKGKRLTTYEVASVKFIEPELPPVSEEPEESADIADVVAPVVEPATEVAVEVAEVAAEQDVVKPAEALAPVEKIVAEKKAAPTEKAAPKAVPTVAPAPAKEEVELIIERPTEEDSRNLENTQLDLFG